MLRSLAIAFALLSAALLFPSNAGAHGGRYRGPSGDGSWRRHGPPPPPPPPPPTTRAPVIRSLDHERWGHETFEDWTFWYHHNNDAIERHLHGLDLSDSAIFRAADPEREPSLSRVTRDLNYRAGTDLINKLLSIL